MRISPPTLSQRLIIGFTLALALGSLLSWLSIERRMEGMLRQRIRADLYHKLHLVHALVGNDLHAQVNGTQDLQSTLRRLGQRLPQRITLIAADGQVLADSDESPERTDNHALRPEMIASQRASDGLAEAFRWSSTVESELFYAALALRDDQGAHRGWIRIAVPLDFIQHQRQVLRWGLGVGVGASGLLALSLAILISRSVLRPVERLSVAAVALGRSECPQIVDRRSLPIHRRDEIGSLARSFATMAKELSQRFDAMARDRNKILAVLLALQEGVLAVDHTYRILHVNQSCLQLLTLVGIKQGDSLPQDSLPQELAVLLADCLQKGAQQRCTLHLSHSGRWQTVLVTISALLDSEQRLVGAVMVVSDQTERERLDAMRRDFIANVSHELKTPLTVIQGLLETLADDGGMPALMRQRFIDKAQNHTRRLGTLVSDLLILSRLESPDRQRDTERFDLQQVIRASIASWRENALAQEISISLESSEHMLPVLGDKEALGQVFDNLLSNAIRYSPAHTAISLRSYQRDNIAVVEVTDQGIGIPEKDQERIFERFYRVDKARSKAVGGTGLGLAIVRHVLLAHGGSISVRSCLGSGSTFTLCLPLFFDSSQQAE